MTTLRALVATALIAPLASGASGPRTLDEHYASGMPFADFLTAVSKRADQWRAHYEAELPADLLSRARAVGGDWRLLVITEDWCGDSAYTIPYVARLAAEVDGLDLRIIDRDAGKVLMQRRLTPDYRAATPTIIVLDPEGRDAGCWVERPSELQEWFQEHRRSLEHDELYAQKYAWYEDDAGRSTLREMVERLEGAAAGRPSKCSK